MPCLLESSAFKELAEPFISRMQCGFTEECVVNPSPFRERIQETETEKEGKIEGSEGFQCHNLF